MAIIFSHSTARSIHRLQSKPLKNAWPLDPNELFAGTPNEKDLKRAQHYLRALGLQGEDNVPIDLLLLRTPNRRKLPGCSVHLNNFVNVYEDIVFLEEGLFIPCVELCALQAATEMNFRELVEYYFELCSAYTLPIGGSGEYRERQVLTSPQKLASYFDRATPMRGSKLARRAIKYVRGGCRSPLETAFALMLCLPKSEGGLGIKKLDVDRCVAVTASARQLTRRRFFYFDIYLPRSKTDIEYNGFYHDAEGVQTVDEERKNALSAMGYEIINVNRHTFFDKTAFARVTAAIMRKEGIRPSSLPSGFFIAQEQLRRFVLRRYLDARKAERYSEHEQGEPFSNEPGPYLDDMQFWS